MEPVSGYDAACAHGPCACPVAKPGDYCSESCKKGLESTDCGCGHEACRAIA